MKPVAAYIGLGANLGDARGAVQAALQALGALPETRLLAQSSLFKTAPVDAGGDDYVNAVAHIATRLPPQQLLERLLEIEQAHGFVPDVAGQAISVIRD